MLSGLCWSRCCLIGRRGVGVRGGITERWSTGCCGGPGQVRRGGISRSRTDHGRPSTTGIGVGRPTAPGRWCWPNSSVAVTPRKMSGRLGSTPPSSALTSTLLVLPTPCRPTCPPRGLRWHWTDTCRRRQRHPQGAVSNDKDLASGTASTADPQRQKAKPADREATGQVFRSMSRWSGPTARRDRKQTPIQASGDHAQTRIPLTARPVHGRAETCSSPRQTPSTTPAEAAPYLCRSGRIADPSGRSNRSVGS